MGKKVLWLAVSGLMVLSLVMAACGPAAPTEATTPTGPTSPTGPTTPTSSTTPTSPVTPSAEEPKYGGVLHFSGGDPTGFDQTFTIHFQAQTMNLTNESLLQGDWATGPAGSGETDFTIYGNILDYNHKTGAIAESWETVEPGHMVFKLRQGVHYALNPESEASRLVNGREVTADDVVWTLKRYTTEPTSYIVQSAPAMCKVVQITAPDKWTIDIQVPPEQFIWVMSYIPDWSQIIPPEVTAKYGDMRDWRNSVGTGPFMLTDYVSSSLLTFTRNPKYWGTDPVGPGKGNQLPYLDNVKVLILPDSSTAMAALRTGKLEAMLGMGYDNAKSMKQTAPKLIYKSYSPESGSMIYMRTDKQDLPFKDIRVRQALMMATDFDTINNALYGGTGVVNTFPVTPVAAYIDAYLPLDEAPAAVQALYKYNPDQAKQLLKDAGFPTGFKTSIVCSTGAVDYLSLIKDMWSKVGIELTLQPKESGILNSIYRDRTHEQMIYAVDGSVGTYVRMLNYDGPSQQNSSYVDDQHVRDVRAQMYDYLYVEKIDEMNALHKELMSYVLEQAWVVPTVLAQPTTFWWPWLKGYHGEASPGNNNMWMWAKYVWIDQDLMKSMGF
jgi:peptide/nickel transport system substrate-binding protein